MTCISGIVYYNIAIDKVLKVISKLEKEYDKAIDIEHLKELVKELKKNEKLNYFDIIIVLYSIRISLLSLCLVVAETVNYKTMIILEYIGND